MIKYKSSYDRWIVLGRGKDYIAPSGAYSFVMLNCRCSCGTERTVRLVSLENGDSKSCGCLGRENLIKSLTTHGMSDSKLYKVWTAMHYRCYNSNSNEYHNYGGRGILVDESWHSFDKFKEDMIFSFAEGLELDRIDNNLGYSKENCSWATSSWQAFNQRKPALNTSGKTGVSFNKHANKWISYISINRKNIYLGLSESIEDAITLRENAELLYFGKVKP